MNMDTLFKQEFNLIYNILELERHHLVSVSIHNEEPNEQAYLSCVPIFQAILNDHYWAMIYSITLNRFFVYWVLILMWKKKLEIVLS